MPRAPLFEIISSMCPSSHLNVINSRVTLRYNSVGLWCLFSLFRPLSLSSNWCVCVYVCESVCASKTWKSHTKVSGLCAVCHSAGINRQINQMLAVLSCSFNIGVFSDWLTVDTRSVCSAIVCLHTYNHHARLTLHPLGGNITARPVPQGKRIAEFPLARVARQIADYF